MAIVAAFLGLRAVNVVQLAASLPAGLAQSPNPGLDALMVTAFVVETVVLASLALRHASLMLHCLIWADVGLGCVLLLGQKLISGPNLMMSWNAWGYAVTLSCAIVAGFGLRSRAETVVAAGALTACYLLVTLHPFGSVAELSAVSTNSLSYFAFAGLARAISGYLRRLGRDADEARQRAAALGAAAETERHRGLLHDQVTVLSLLSQAPTDARLQTALRLQAADGAMRIAAFMSGISDSILVAGTLGSAVRLAVVQFSDLPLTCTVDLVDGFDVQAPVAEAVQGAVTTLLHNIRRHACAASCVVHADADPVTGWWEVLVRDDGRGFTPANTPRGYGLTQQVEAAMDRIGVEVTVRSAPGEGTMVILTRPGPEVANDRSLSPRESPGSALLKTRPS